MEEYSAKCACKLCSFSLSSKMMSPFMVRKIPEICLFFPMNGIRSIRCFRWVILLLYFLVFGYIVFHFICFFIVEIVVVGTLIFIYVYYFCNFNHKNLALNIFVPDFYLAVKKLCKTIFKIQHSNNFFSPPSGMILFTHLFYTWLSNIWIMCSQMFGCSKTDCFHQINILGNLEIWGKTSNTIDLLVHCKSTLFIHTFSSCCVPVYDCSIIRMKVSSYCLAKSVNVFYLYLVELFRLKNRFHVAVHLFSYR